MNLLGNNLGNNINPMEQSSPQSVIQPNVIQPNVIQPNVIQSNITQPITRPNQVDDLDSPYDVTTNHMFLSLPKESQEAVMNYGKSKNYFNANGIGTKKSGQQLLADVESDPDLFTQTMSPVIENKKQNVISMYNQLIKAMELGDNNKINIAKNAYNKLNSDYQKSQSIFSEHMKKFNTQQNIQQDDSILNEISSLFD